MQRYYQYGVGLYNTNNALCLSFMKCRIAAISNILSSQKTELSVVIVFHHTTTLPLPFTRHFIIFLLLLFIVKYMCPHLSPVVLHCTVIILTVYLHQVVSCMASGCLLTHAENLNHINWYIPTQYCINYHIEQSVQYLYYIW